MKTACRHHLTMLERHLRQQHPPGLDDIESSLQRQCARVKLVHRRKPNIQSTGHDTNAWKSTCRIAWRHHQYITSDHQCHYRHLLIPFTDAFTPPLPTRCSSPKFTKQLRKAIFASQAKHNNPPRPYAASRNQRLTTANLAAASTSHRFTVRSDSSLFSREVKGAYSATECSHFATTLEPGTCPPTSTRGRRCRRRRLVRCRAR